MLTVMRFRHFQTMKQNINLLKMSLLVFENHIQFSTSSICFQPKPIFKSPSLPDYRGQTYGSQFVPNPPLETAEQRIKDYLMEKKPRTYDEWLDAKDEFYTNIPLISDLNYSSIVMNVLLQQNDVETAKSFMKYLKESPLKPNVLAYLQYIALCGKNTEHCDQKEILENLEKIQQSIDNSLVLDLKRVTYIIQGLCGTDRWRTAFDYLKKLPRSPTGEIKNALAGAAIKNGNETLAWEIVQNWFKKTENLSNHALYEFLKYANCLVVKNKREAEIFISKFFLFVKQNDVVFNETAARLCIQFFKKHSSKWKIHNAKVNRNGECEVCHRFLNTLDLNDMDFALLKKSFLEKSLKKSDIFINTTEEEFHKFISFMEKHEHFHIVIDGLNAAYTLGHGHQKSRKNLAQHLLKVVERISSKSRKVLVLGRKQMKGWPPYFLKKITQRSRLFLTSDISQDDPFIVYAALASGPNTYFITNDLLRDHFSRLDDPKLIMLFKKWQQSRQVILNVDEEDFKIVEPVRHCISIQGNMEKGWHIPYDDGVILDPYEELNNWLCIQKMES